MEHKHSYETVYRPILTPEAAELGIRAAEVRKCRTCERVMTFILTHEKWIPLFEDRETEGQDILLA